MEEGEAGAPVGVLPLWPTGSWIGPIGSREMMPTGGLPATAAGAAPRTAVEAGVGAAGCLTLAPAPEAAAAADVVVFAGVVVAVAVTGTES